MESRVLGRTGKSVGVVGLGAWQLGADWGDIDEAQAFAVLDAAVAAGVTFIDTADVYGDGRSEQLIGRFRTRHPEIMVATKMGRRLELVPSNYVMANFRAWIERSLTNLGVDRLDLVQLHCPPTAVYRDDAVFDALDTLVDEGSIAAYGVSVETREEALLAIARPGVATVQIVLNLLRLGPIEAVLPEAAALGVGIIARVPLASGLLSGRYDESTTFPADDHRSYNRHGEAFDVGETFSGVDFATGLAAVRRLAEVKPADVTMAQFALRWIIDQAGVSVVIPGARNEAQVRGNVAAAAVPPLSQGQLDEVRSIYAELVAPEIAGRW